MKKAVGNLIAFWVIFIGLQIWPISEGPFDGYTPWDILLFKLACARGSLFSEIAVAGCAEISDFTVSVALGQIAGDAAFVGFVLLVAYFIQRRSSRKKVEWEVDHGQMPAEISGGEYVEWLRVRVHELEAPSSVRNRGALAAFALTQTHHHAIVLLCEHGLFGSAFSLVRSCFESYVRGQWLLNCATDAQLEKFLAGRDPPNLTVLISAIEKVPGFEENVLSKFKHQFWHSLCAYTHSGGLHLQRWQTDDAVEPNYPPDEIAEVLSFAEALGSIATIAILGVADRTVVADDVLKAFRGRSNVTYKTLLRGRKTSQ